MADLQTFWSKVSISNLVNQYRPDLSHFENLYRALHADPELSLQESKTATAVAKELESLTGIEVKTKIGGHGVVGVLRNGAGKVVLLRAELDALPLQERTGLDYSSTKWTVDPADNVKKPIMHACGHDMHMTALLAASRLLYMCRKSWTGTLIILFQPNEEHGAGAQAMVDDGLYDANKHAIPVPDVVLGGHISRARAGGLSTRAGIFNSAADSFKVTVYGRGGHGSQPHKTVDPAVLASSIVMKLQTIVSRETDPQEAAVVTVGAMHVGQAENVISDEAILRINTRSFTSQTRAHIRASIERIVRGECMAAGSPKPPLIQETTTFPLLYNNETVTGNVSAVMKTHFGEDFEPNAPASMGSEDIANLATPISAPVCFWSFGGTNPHLWDDIEQRGKLDEDIPGTMMHWHGNSKI